jgi:serine/threonine protein kinase/Flp pilus assembly protein TadD
MGTYRAIKIVYRATFDSDRPYDREFEGLRKFEPISRSHESQVHILHVGRSELEDYFYHVMELADNANGLPKQDQSRPYTGSRSDIGPSREDSASFFLDPEQYVPRTLASDLKARGRLPFEECLRIGLALTTALDHLHGHGLIHRDIKPANVIFVNGLPKLADIGLVAAADATCSFVGTEGYLPPEGPGSMQADLYSLGKVLYEISTGQDRRDFPTLPSQSGTDEEEKWQMELNAVVLRACKPGAQQRYASAQAMHEDLLLLLAGNSVRHTHAIERRLALMTRVGAAFAAVIILGAIPCYLAIREARRARSSEKREHVQRQLAIDNEAKTRRVAQFLKDILNGLEPSFALGPDTSVARKFLDSTADRVGKDLRDQPSVEAETRNTLGQLYLQLGYPQQAEAMFSRSLALQKAAHGEGHPAVAQALSDLSFALASQGRLREAEGLQTQALATRRKFFGNTNAEVAQSLSGLGGIWRNQSRLAESEVAFREVLEIRQRVLGAEHARVAESMIDLATVLASEGKWADSGALYRRGLEMERKLLGENHPSIAVALNSFVPSLLAQREFGEAEARGQEALAIRRKIFGNDHPAIAESLTTLANALMDQDKTQEAKTNLREALEIRKRRFGAEDPALAETLKSLVAVLLDERQSAEAQNLLNEALAPSDSGQPQSARLLRARGNFLARTGRWHEAAEDFCKAIEYEPENHEAYHELAPVLVQSGELDQYRRLCDRIRQSFGETLNDPSIADRMAKDCLILPCPGADLTVEARWAEVTVKLCKSDRARPWSQFCRGLVEYRQGNFSNAVEWLNPVLKQVGDVEPRDVEAYMVLAMAQKRLNKIDEARAAFSAGNQIRNRSRATFGDGVLPDSWKDWVVAEALTQEAKSLIERVEDPR